MQPMLDDLELPQVQTLRVHDRRSLAEHRAPGMDGSYFQNLGRRATTIAVTGVVTGPEALEFVESLTEIFDAGEPVTFVTDIVTDAEIDEVIVDDMKVREVGGKPFRYAYAMILREHQAPVEPEELSALQNDLLEDANSLLDDLVDGLDLSLDFSTGLERFIDPLTDLLGRLRELNQGSR